MDKYRFDCIHFRGYKPCARKKVCWDCNEFSKVEKKVLIIKLGALGDVLRTTPVLFALAQQGPGVHVTWVTKRNAKEMLELSPRIHRLVYVDDPDNGALLRLMVENFDEVHCYDKEDAAIGLAALVKAKKRFGFEMNKWGHMAPINKASNYSFDLGLSDELKFEKNTKTYQELTYESSEFSLPEKMDHYDLVISSKDREVAAELLRKKSFLGTKNGGNRPLIGLNTGSGRVFQTKQWFEEYFLELGNKLHREMNAQVLLLGGKDEDARNTRLAEKMKGLAFYPGCDFNIREFAAILESCDVCVTGDTLAMHLAVALKTRCVVLFGSTCPQEVDLYGYGEKIISKPDCAPCYKNNCDKPDFMRCMKDIVPQRVFDSIQNQLRACAI